MSETKTTWEHEGFMWGRIRVVIDEDAGDPVVEMKADRGGWHLLAEGAFSVGAAMADLLKLVRAADRMRELVNDILPMYIGDDYKEILETRDAYDAQRAAVGEIS